MMTKPRILPLDTPYTTEVHGYGELYEIASVRRLQRRLKRKYHPHDKYYLFLLPNLLHNKKHGSTVEHLSYIVKYQYDCNPVEQGYIDTPGWKSSPQPLKNPPSTIPRFFSSILFYFLTLFETPDPHRSHMIYVLAHSSTPLNLLSPDDPIFWSD